MKWLIPIGIAVVILILVGILPILIAYQWLDVANSPGPHGAGPFFILLSFFLGVTAFAAAGGLTALWLIGGQAQWKVSCVAGSIAGAITGCVSQILLWYLGLWMFGEQWMRELYLLSFLLPMGFTVVGGLIGVVWNRFRQRQNA